MFTPDYARFRNSLLSFSHDPAHSSADMAVVCVLGHGTEGGVFAADGVKVEAEKIYEYLNNEGCPDLRGKPKLFIMQACRGELKDKSWFSALVSMYLGLLKSICNCAGLQRIRGFDNFCG